jgi:hypothetical protein
MKLLGGFNHNGLVGSGERNANFTLINHSGCDNSLFKAKVIACLFKVLLCFLVLVVIGFLGYGCMLYAAIATS